MRPKNKGDKKITLKRLNREKSMLPRLVVIFLLLILIPLTVLGHIATTGASDALIESAKHNISSTVEQTSRYFDTVVIRTEAIMEEIAMDRTIQELVSKKSDNYGETRRLSEEKLAAVIEANDYINGIYVILGKDSYVYSGSEPSIDMDGILKSGWYLKVKGANGKLFWVNEHTGLYPKQRYSIALGKYVSQGQSDGVIILDLNYDVFSKVLMEIVIGKKDTLYIATPTQKIITREGERATESSQRTKLTADIVERATSNHEGIFEYDNGIKNIAAYHQSEVTGWYAIALIPYEVVTERSASMQLNVIGAGAIFSLVAVVIGIMVSLGITKNIKSLMDAMQRAASGDLKTIPSIKRKDEMGRLVDGFNSMVAQMRDLIGKSKSAVESVNNAVHKVQEAAKSTAELSEDVSKAMEQVATGATEQAMDTDKGLKAVQSLADKIDTVINDTKQMEETSERFRELTDNGIKAMQVLENKTDGVRSITTQLVEEMKALGSSIKKIGSITQFLNGIADQTQLLALNASIEAARCGEDGRGFEVIASEVRKLAEQSTSATKDIEGLVNEIFVKAEESTNIVYQADDSIKEQNEAVKESTEVFAKIASSTKAIVTSIGNIFNAINEIGQSKDEVTASIQSISTISESVAASAEEVAASTESQLASIQSINKLSEELTLVANELSSDMKVFILE